MTTSNSNSKGSGNGRGKSRKPAKSIDDKALSYAQRLASNPLSVIRRRDWKSSDQKVSLSD